MIWQWGGRLGHSNDRNIEILAYYAMLSSKGDRSVPIRDVVLTAHLNELGRQITFGSEDK